MKVRSADFETSAPEYELCPPPNLPEFAFIGRSNVGKSSLLNMLTGRKALARVSARPGATQMINFFTINGNWSLVDLPGYGYSKTPQAVRENFQKAVSDYLANRESLSCVFVLIDGRLTPQKIDLDFCDWLAVGGVPFVIAFTKADKTKAGKLKSNVEAFLAELADRVEGEPRWFVTSAPESKGREEMLEFIGQVLESC
ncbi:GTP-binding protein EngB [Haloferula helveola]|uniref:Probable GTP-binding protein EngB n=1 Tax=Haloferula helveola TaxID=490095 RepID=A0ABM7RK83_9BACT|nr:GTP-binding protein EngB [Haloferula helveola]